MLKEPQGSILRILKQQYGTSSKEEEYLALRKYDAVRSQSIKQGKVQIWLEEFDQAYNLIKEQELPESNDKHVKQQFLRAISAISYSFTDRQAELLNKPTYAKEDFKTLLSRYRAYLANSEGLGQASNFAFTTLNGQDAGKKNKGSEKLTCLCSKRHYYKDCWFIIASKRPKG